MTTLKLLGAAAILSTLIVTSASAEHMIDEPGMFAFVHPNGDLGIGSSRPAADAQAMAPAPRPVMRHPVRQAKSSK
ncbi:MAG: hypothetical protein ABJA75_03190 [Bradyrhizobium sp.]